MLSQYFLDKFEFKVHRNRLLSEITKTLVTNLPTTGVSMVYFFTWLWQITPHVPSTVQGCNQNFLFWRLLITFTIFSKQQRNILTKKEVLNFTWNILECQYLNNWHVCISQQKIKKPKLVSRIVFYRSYRIYRICIILFLIQKMIFYKFCRLYIICRLLFLVILKMKMTKNSILQIL